MSRKQAKATAWRWFSLYIRTRESVNGQCKCVTCGKVAPIKEMDAGHFVGGRKNSILFIETNCHPQCPACNRYGQGMGPEYYVYMEQEYGTIEIERLMGLRKVTLKLSEQDFRDIANDYRLKYKELANG